MNMLHKSLLPLAFCMTLVANVQADDGDKKQDSDKDKMAEKTVTVHGVISGFTVVGETDLDRSTGTLMTARATMVTVIGHPWMHESDQKEHAESAEKTSGSDHSAHHHRRMNLYVAMMTPKTKVCEVTAEGKEMDLSDKNADYDDLEIGDRVELVINLKDMDKMMNKDSKADRDDDKEQGKKDDDGKKTTMTKHGRHRTYMGMAEQVKLMPDHMEGMHHDGKNEHKDSNK